MRVSTINHALRRADGRRPATDRGRGSQDGHIQDHRCGGSGLGKGRYEDTKHEEIRDQRQIEGSDEPENLCPVRRFAMARPTPINHAPNIVRRTPGNLAGDAAATAHPQFTPALPTRHIEGESQAPMPRRLK